MPHEFTTDDGTVINFPFVPYTSQKQTISMILNCLKTNTSGLIEAPTGSGKTHSILASVIAYCRHNKKKIFVCSRTIKQIDQMICSFKTYTNTNNTWNTWNLSTSNMSTTNNKNTSNMSTSNMNTNTNTNKSTCNMNNNNTNTCNTSNTIPNMSTSNTNNILNNILNTIPNTFNNNYTLNYTLKMTILSSRKQFCINNDAHLNLDINDYCQTSLRSKDKICRYFKNVETLSSEYEHQTFNLEDIIITGTKKKACPYFATRNLLNSAEIVFAPYNYLIDPFIRNSLGIDLKDCHVIVDEAHNIEDFCRNAGSCVISSYDFRRFENCMKKVLVRGNLDEEVYNGIMSIRDLIKCFTMFEKSLKRHKHNTEDNNTKNTEKNTENSKISLNSNKNSTKTSNISKFTNTNTYTNNSFSNTNNISKFTNTNNSFSNTITSTKTSSNTNNISKFTNTYNTNNISSNTNNISEFTNTNTTIRELNNTFRTYKGSEIKDILTSLQLTPPLIAYCKSSTKTLQQKHPSILPQTLLTTIELLIYILENILINNHLSYAFHYKKTDLDQFTINFWLLDPSTIFASLTSTINSIILLSGTLKPFLSLQNELNFNFKNVLEAEHVICPQNVNISVVKNGYNNFSLVGKYSESENLLYLNQIKECILSLRGTVVNGGCLVFVPSYTVLSLLETHLDVANVYFESKNHLKFDKILKKYKNDTIKNGTSKNYNDTSKNYHDSCKNDTVKNDSCKYKNDSFKNDTNEYDSCKNDYNNDYRYDTAPILICVYRGRASEGIDFKDNHARLVILIGIPYASYRDPEILAKRDYNDKFKKISGQEWYESAAFRAVNQAIGRVVRHKNDYGAVVFLDCRYAWSRNLKRLSKWVRENVRIHGSIESVLPVLTEFFKSKTIS